MTVKAVIFDLDGTITEPFFDFDAIRAQMGLERDAGPVLEAMEKMSPDRRREAERILHFHETRAVEQSRLNPGTRRTFTALRRTGIRIGILTRNRRCNALAIAAKHRLQFDAIVDREDGPVKPDAFGVLRIKPAETIVVGDYLFDLLCARSAGAVAVLLANSDRAAEFQQYADFTIDRIDQVLEIIEQINGAETSQRKVRG